MINGFENLQKAGQDGMTRSMESFAAIAKGWQTLATQASGFSKVAVDEGTAYFEKLLSAKSFDVAMGAQTDFARAQYEQFVGQATRFGETYLGVMRDAVRPFEGFVPAPMK